MREIDKAYRVASGLSARDDYKIFYSRLQLSWLMTIGINPGGKSNNWFEATSTGFYEDGRHDFIEHHDNALYDLAKPMYTVLQVATGLTDTRALCDVPHTNMSFRRSVDSTGCKSWHIKEAQPFLRRVLDIVQPRFIIFVGNAYKFALHEDYGFLRNMHNHKEMIPIENGKSTIHFLREFDASFRKDGQPVHAVALAHPSRYAKRVREWQKALSLLDRCIAPFRPARLS